MATCNDCEKEMKTADSCTHTKIRYNGRWLDRSRKHFNERDGRCHDCGIKHDGIHHFGCDVERCPVCGGQLISCACFRDKRMRNKITLRK